MRITRYEMVTDTVIGIKFREVIRWFLLYFFLEMFFPFLLDPLNLYQEYMGYEIEDMLELLMFIVIPLLVSYYLGDLSGYASFFGLGLYLIITCASVYSLVLTIFSDLFVLIIIVIFLDDAFASFEGEAIHQDDLYYF